MNIPDIFECILQDARNEFPKIRQALMGLVKHKVWRYDTNIHSMSILKKSILDTPIDFTYKLSSIGMAFFSPTQHIELNVALAFPINRLQLQETIAHEMAHIINYNCGNCDIHGPNWKKWAVILGANPEATVENANEVIKGWQGVRAMKRNKK